MIQTSLFMALLTSGPPPDRHDPAPDRPDGVPGWIPVWEPPWPPSPWEAAAFDSPFHDEPPVQGWQARWPDGATAWVRPWEQGTWIWGAEVGQSHDAHCAALHGVITSPREAIQAAEAWLAETREGIARGDWA